MSENRKPKIFISYSHVDKKWKEFIKGFFHKNLFDMWDDGHIELGENWFNKIRDSLHDADIALLLLSKDFINSDFINSKELPVFFERCKNGDVQIVYVFLRYYPYKTVDWITKEGESLQGYIAPDKPLDKFLNKKFERSPKLEKKISILVDKVRDIYNKKENPVLQQYYKKNLQKSEDKTLDYLENKDCANQIKTNNIFVHFRQDTLEDNKYIVDIYTRYKEIHLNKTIRDIIIKDINLLECQQEFMENFYQFRKNIPIHFIVPPELYLYNFRLWKDDLELVELFHPIYLHSDTRYSQNVDEYEFMIEKWDEEFLPKNTLSDTLHPIIKADDRYGIRTKKIGIYYEYQPSDITINNHLEIAKIALWSQKPEKYKEWMDKNITKIKLEELPNELQECEQVSLLWDDMSMLVDLKKELET